MSSDSTAAHPWPIDHLRLAVEAAGVALWSWNVDTDAFTMDERGFELWALPWSRTVTFRELSVHIHPADRDRVSAAFAATRTILGAYETDFRIMVGDDVRWIASRGQGNDAGIVERTMFGIFLDVTGRKLAEESSELLAGEMSHRVKNLLTIAAGLTQITSRATDTTRDMTRELTERLAALGRAHNLVRPVAGTSGAATLLGDLLSVLLAPYDAGSAYNNRIRIAVERIGVGEETGTGLALIIHELATNSMKYGALSAPGGTLDISSVTANGEIALRWLESGGPTITERSEPEGFGSRLVRRSVTGQLGGSISYDWAPDGLIVTLRMTQKRLAL